MSVGTHSSPSPSPSAELRAQGNVHFTAGEYEKALKLYLSAEQSLGTADTADDIAKLCSNISACYIQLPDDEAKTLALQYADKCIEKDARWNKGWFRRASALDAMGRKKECCLALKRMFDLAPNVTDPLILGLMKKSAYFTDADVLAANPYLARERLNFADGKIYVVDPHGAGHFTTVLEAVVKAEPGAVVLVRPGAYAGGFELQRRDLELIGDIPLDQYPDHDATRSVVIHGRAEDRSPTACCAVVRVRECVLHLRNVHLRQAAAAAAAKEHVPTAEDLHALVLQGPHSQATLHRCLLAASDAPAVVVQGSSSLEMVACQIADSGGGVLATENADLMLRKCELKNVKKIAVELRDEASATLDACTFHKIGKQAVSAHTGAGGELLVVGCDVFDAGRVPPEEYAVSFAKGRCTLETSKVHDNAGGGVIVMQGAQAELYGNQLYSNRVHAVGFSLSGNGIVRENDIYDNAVGVAVFNNGKGRVELDGNSVRNTAAPVTVAKGDMTPAMRNGELVVSEPREPPGLNSMKKLKEGTTRQHEKKWRRDGFKDGALLEEFAHQQQNGKAVGVVCRFCGLPEPAGKKYKRCGRCRTEVYCSVECQQRDWPSHRAQCSKSNE